MSDNEHREPLEDAQIVALLADPAVFRLLRFRHGWEYYDYTGYPNCRGWVVALTFREAVNMLASTLGSRPTHVK